jgi:C4-dicarboxylate-specific signal transduction histidine kinase
MVFSLYADDGILIQVEVNGIGLSNDSIGDLFEPFFIIKER